MAEEVRTEAQINEQLTALSAKILPKGLTLRYLPIDALKEQDLNPRSMPVAMFDQLVSTVKKTGGLESVPLCADVAGQVQVISGHHRTRAARQAGLTHVTVLVYDNITKSSLIAKQLAHNTINGKDDVEMVKRLFAEIDELPAKFEAFVDPKAAEELPDPVRFTPVDVNLQDAMKAVMLLFLPVQHADIQKLMDRLPKGESDTVYLAARETFDAWVEAVKKVREGAEIVAIPTAVAEMARLAGRAIDEELHVKESRDKDGETWVPLRDVFKTARIPASVAYVLREAVARKVAQGDVNVEHPWQALEQWAAETLAGL
jgi:hypothetical protein